jgi:hypothetical protein
MNPEHVRRTQEGFAKEYDPQDVMSMLGIKLLIDRDSMHPHVACVPTMPKKQAI